jgi:AAA domain
VAVSKENLRIVRVRLRSFRAVPGELIMYLSNTDSLRAQSCLLLGDNGTGKSSIIEAIEFALQARVHPFFGADDKRFERIPNLRTINSEHCLAEVTLSDGSTHSRSIIRNNVGHLNPEEIDVVPAFQATFALRREDILSFLRMPADQRPQLFAAFLRSVAATKTVASSPELEAVNAAEAELELIGVEQSKLARKLANRLHVSKHRVGLYDSKAIESLFVEKRPNQKCARATWISN